MFKGSAHPNPTFWNFFFFSCTELRITGLFRGGHASDKNKLPYVCKVFGFTKGKTAWEAPPHCKEREMGDEYRIMIIKLWIVKRKDVKD